MSTRLDRADWVLVFGGRTALEEKERIDEIFQQYPGASVTFCSTAGEIWGDAIYDDSLSLTAIEFEHSRLRTLQVDYTETADPLAEGRRLGTTLVEPDLSMVFVLGDGQSEKVAGLLDGLNASLPENVPVTGGLAGDGLNFQRCVVGLNEVPAPGRLVVVGLYGERLHVGHGCRGGWSKFGPSRMITRSEGNVLYELDEQPALKLYKEYLGERSAELPGSALLFPLSIDFPDLEEPLVRTVLNVDEDDNSMLYAGAIPEGARCRLMYTQFDRLLNAVGEAADDSLTSLKGHPPELTILVSCVGRKLIMGLRAEDEVEEVRSVVGEHCHLTGFYSYGELSPVGHTMGCQLHNQTMTITTFSER